MCEISEYMLEYIWSENKHKNMPSSPKSTIDSKNDI